MAETGCSFVESIPKALAKQIHVREEKFGKPVKTVEELETIHGNCPWVLLRSGVNAPVTDSHRFEVFQDPEKECPTTNDWATKTVFGGELQHRREDADTGVNIRPAIGVDQVHANSKGNPFMYRLMVQDENGSHKSSMGHRPVGGITEVHVTSKDTWGMIMEAEIKLKVWSKDDLEDLDRVYFKPGYTVLLEWGHTLFFNNEGKNKKALGPTISSKRFWEGGDYTKLDQEILDVREDGSRDDYANHEVLFGYVTNFSFSFNKDGSYDCTLKMLSKGSVIAGLKIKGVKDFQSGEVAESEDESEEKPVNFEDISIWHRIYQAFSVTTNDTDVRGNERGWADTLAVAAFGAAGVLTMDLFRLGASILNARDAATSPIYNTEIEAVSDRIPSLDTLWKFPNREAMSPIRGSVLNGKQAILNAKNEEGAKLFREDSCKGLESFPVIQLPTYIHKGWFIFSTNDISYEPYMTLRSLLHLINVFNTERGRFQFNCWENAPYVDIPTNPTEEGKVPAVSFNPLVAVKPAQGTIDEAAFSLWDTSATGDIPSQYVAKETRNDSDYKKILNIWVNFGKFVSIVHNGLRSNKEYTVLEALEELLQNIQAAFGNINEFKVVADHKWGGSVFSIIDTKDVRAPETIADLPERINVTGLNNTVTDLEIKSEISPEMANMMCIAAQAPAPTSENTEETDEAVVRWGENCKQRWVLPQERQPADNVQENDDAAEKEEFNKGLKKFIRRLKRLYRKVRRGASIDSQDGQTVPELVSVGADEMFGDIQLNGDTYMHSQVMEDTRAQTEEGKSNLQMGVIPIRAGLTMLGIGNFKVGNVFRLGTNVLLKKYENWGHIVTGIEHTIDKSGWKTTLKTQYYPVSQSAASGSGGINSGDTSDSNCTLPVDNGGGSSSGGRGTVEITHAANSQNNTVMGDGNGKEVLTENIALSTLYKATSDRGYGMRKIFRCKDQNAAKNAAKVAKKLAASSKIGYNTDRRNTLFKELILSGKYFGSTPEQRADNYVESGPVTDTDCTAFCQTCYAAGNYAAFGVVGATATSNFELWRTSTVESKLASSPLWEVLNFTTDSQLQIGDLLCTNGQGHMMMVTGVNGSSAAPIILSSNSAEEYPAYYWKDMYDSSHDREKRKLLGGGDLNGWGKETGDTIKSRGYIVDVNLPVRKQPDGTITYQHQKCHKGVKNDLLSIFQEIINETNYCSYGLGGCYVNKALRHGWGVAIDTGNGGFRDYKTNPWFNGNCPQILAKGTLWSTKFTRHNPDPGLSSNHKYDNYDPMYSIWAWDHPVIAIFKRHGWGWGGAYGDTMHFSLFQGK